MYVQQMKYTEGSSGADSSCVFLNGKVMRRVLPVIRDASTPHPPLLKRLLLAQGELAQFYDADEGIRYLAAIELREGGVRGNHYHRQKEERIYVVQGELELVLEDPATRARATIPVRSGELAAIQAGVAHALKTIQSGFAVEFSPSRFDPADTHRYPL